MRRTLLSLLIPIATGLGSLLCLHSAGEPALPGFTRLEQLPAPRIVASAEAYPDGRYNARNIVDGNPRTEYASNDKGTDTFVEFDFGAATPVAGFRHIERDDPATVVSSELIFMDASGGLTATVPVTHVNRRAGVTFLALPSPITARRVRWRVTGLVVGHAVGGAEIAFFRAGKTEPLPLATSITGCGASPMLEREGAALVQRLTVTVNYPYKEPVLGTIRLVEGGGRTVPLRFGTQTADLLVPAVESPKTVEVEVEARGATVAKRGLSLKPVPKLEVFVLPHSHNDIGYTALQADVEKKQNSNIEAGLRLAEATADYPEGARFKWNVEVLWCVDNYLRTATPEQRVAFIAAVKNGQIGLDAFYGNVLTGLCRPEELINLMAYATRLSKVCGVPIESAMISDVPGYTWSTVSAMAHAGVKYFSFGPNYGDVLTEWQNRPFWWKGPDGRGRVLCWCPTGGYALGHRLGEGEALTRFIPGYLEGLQARSYPYDLAYLRWNVHGDNGSPDEKLADVVRDWNVRYAYPRLIIATTAEPFRELERRYGDKLPVVSGDFTPYWENGAASSALETAMNRASTERLVQAETLWALCHRDAASFPADAFHEAWRNALLYSEHTWGAMNSVSEPDLPFVRDQWKVKRGFALDGDRLSRQLLAQALQGETAAASATGAALFDVFNTCSWERTDLVTLTAEQSAAGNRLVDEASQQPVPSQRLSSGALIFLAQGVPPLSARRFRVQAGPSSSPGAASAQGAVLTSPGFTIRIDEQTGAIKNLFSHSLQQELVNPQSAASLNDYFYLLGSDLKSLQRNGVPRITAKENGPLLASLLIESDAPGCNRLLREVRLIAGLDRVELVNTVDKLPVRTKEGVHFGFGFNVPNGTVRMDVGWAAVRPELDQMPTACKNWFSVQRWLDISNDRFGVTWSPVDAPLVEVGGITATLSAQTDSRAWIRHLAPSQTIYSFVMNNHWDTNYRADQAGPATFRYAIRPHKLFAAEDAARFGVACSHPLIAVPASGPAPGKPRLELSSDKVMMTALKPSDDGKAWIVRLFGASGKPEKVKLAWAAPVPQQVWLSDTSEEPREKLGPSVEVPGWGIVTLRAE